MSFLTAGSIWHLPEMLDDDDDDDPVEKEWGDD